MPANNTPIFIAGAGSWGTALALLLARNKNVVHLWDHNSDHIAKIIQSRVNQRYLPDFTLPSSILLFDDLKKALQDIRDIFLVVPSHAFRHVLEKMRPLLTTNIRLGWGTKGFDPGSGLLLHQVAAEIVSDVVPLAVLSGPSFAQEVAADKPTAVSIAGSNEEFVNSLITRFHNPRFRLYRNSDFVGVEIFGAVKNIMAIAVGISDGMGFGANARCALITRGLAEIGRLALVLGGRAETMMSLAGVGDLVLTCTDNQSRNRRFGLALGQGKSVQEALTEIGQAVEGVSNTREVYLLARRHQVDMPVIEQVNKVLHENLNPQEVIKNLMQRELKKE